MDRKSVPGAEKRNKGPKRTRRNAGLWTITRNGYWHISGTVVAQGRSVRVRKSTGLLASQENRQEAEDEAERIADEIKSEIREGVRPSPFTAIAVERYLTAPRRRPFGATTIEHLKRVAAEFGLRQLRDIPEHEWAEWADSVMAGNKSETRERFLNSVVAFLNWAAKKPRKWCEVPEFDRDKQARNPRRRARRQVQDLSTGLVDFMISHAAPHLRAQLWTEWSTGARVSSILHGCALADVILGEGREQITFHNTKNGEPVTASLHPRAVAAIKDYLEVRGRLHDRSGPLFLRPDGKPYAPGRGGQNKTAFNGMKRRARKSIRQRSIAEARKLVSAGKHEDAAALVAEARESHRLLAKVTQHWFRHMVATKMARQDLRSAMEQGGWLDERSIIGYTFDVPEHRRKIVQSLDDDDGKDFGYLKKNEA